MVHPALQNPNQKPKTGRKLIFFVLFIFALFAALTTAWYWAAGKLDQTVNNTKLQLASNGSHLDCKDQKVKGYPFRLGVFCSSVLFVDPVNVINVKAGAVRSAAQLYKPGHIITEIDSPVDLQVPNLAPLSIDWQQLSSSINISTSGLNRASLHGKIITVSANDAGFKQALGTIEEVQLHTRPSGFDTSGNSFDFSTHLKNWKIADDGVNIVEPIDLIIDVTIEQFLVLAGQNANIIDYLRANGGKGQVRTIKIATQTGGEFSIAGQLEVSTAGLVSGDIDLTIINPETLISFAGKVFPPAQPALVQALPFLEGFAKNTGDQVTIKDLKIRLHNGDIMLGFFKVGQIPRLF